jgi:hypothetical protein
MKKLFAETLETTTIENLGTVRSLVGKKGKLHFNQNNFSNPDKALMVILENEKGQQDRVFCSVAVGQGVRNKSISIGELMNLLVAPGTTEEGEEIFRIIRPQGATFTLDASKIEDKVFTPKVLSDEELVSLLA